MLYQILSYFDLNKDIEAILYVLLYSTAEPNDNIHLSFITKEIRVIECV